MSIEFLNPENRNNRLSRAPRRCSFCRAPGHNITRCISDRLLEFELVCERESRNIETQEVFKEWLTQNYSDSPDLLKTFAISKFRVNSRINITDCIELIAHYIFSTYKGSPVSPLVEDNIESELLRMLISLRDVGQQEPINIAPENDPQFLHNTRREYMMYMTDVFLIAMLSDMLSQNMEEVHPTRQLNIASNVDCAIFEDTPISNECSICLEQIESCNFVKLNCKHDFCKECVIQTIKTDKRSAPCCALCRSEISSITSVNIAVQNEISNAVA